MKDFIRILILGSFLTLSSMCVPVPVPAQDDGQLRAIMFLAGASSEEELDEGEVERYLHFASHPLEINLAGHSRLLSSGLMSRYQVASLEGYLSRSGDVLSFSELATVDGFGPEYVSALKPFISLRSRSSPGIPRKDSLPVMNDALARLTLRKGASSYGAKYKVSSGLGIEGSLACKSGLSGKEAFPPSSWSPSISVQGRHRPWRLVLGDYNLRFGQGLTFWSGLSLTGFSSSSSFCRRPTGLSQSWSWTGTGTHRGVAGDLGMGRFVLTGFFSFPGLRDACEGRDADISTLGGANIGWFGRSGQVSATAYNSRDGGKASCDFRWNYKGMDFFGEAATSFPGAEIGVAAGAVLPLGNDWKLSGVARRYPSGFDSGWAGGLRSRTKTSDEIGAAVGIEKYGMQVTADFSVKDTDRSNPQLKGFMKVPLQVSDAMVLSLRATERIRPAEEYLKYRTDLRADLDWSSSGLSARYGPSDEDAWKGRLRAEFLLCRSPSGLFYAEAGRKASLYAAYLRGTLFLVDNWDDRIYSYERDAPGSFNVPAYYGRGFSLSAFSGWKFRLGKAKALKVYLRASTTRYPFMKEPKETRNELRFQAMASF